MQRIAILILILAVAGGVFFVVSQDESGPGPDLNADDGTSPKKGGDTDGGMGPKAKAGGPRPSPEPVHLTLRSPASALLIGKWEGTWNKLLLMECDRLRSLNYSSWFMHSVGGKGGEHAGEARGMSELKSKPTADYLKDEDVRVLILDLFDPNAFSAEFWAAVQSRVTSGRMGLLVRPGIPATFEGGALTEHPMLSHPVVKELLPVTRAAQLTGQPVPGVFGKPVAMEPTDEGRRHPASRLIADPDVSAEAWAAAGEGDGALRSQFCYPVQDIRPGAQALVNLKAATSLPMLIATAPSATERVLWMGNIDFSTRTHFVRSKDAIQKTLVNHWLVWLAGQTQ